MTYAEWLERTKGDLFHRGRSALLQTLDRAFDAWEKNQGEATYRALVAAFKAWIDSKGGRDSMRNRSGAVDELNEMLEAAAIPLAPALPKMKPLPAKPHKGPGGDPFAAAAKTARDRMNAQFQNRKVVDVDGSQTITYPPGRGYQKYNAATTSWYHYTVPPGPAEDVDYPIKLHMDLIIRGTVLEVNVQCHAKAGVSNEVRNEWAKHMVAAWNNRAKLVDLGDDTVKPKIPKRTLDIQFSVEWVPAPAGHAYSIGLGNTTPTVQKTGAAFTIGGAVVYLSELRAMALAAPDLAAWKTAKLAGLIPVWDTGTGAWKAGAVASAIPELADLLKSVDSTATFKVQDEKSNRTLGPWKVNAPEMRDLIARGLLHASTQVLKTGTYQWKKAEDWPELKGFLTPEAERKAWAKERNKTVNAGVFGDADREGILHEFGHFIGNPDEYEVTKISASLGQVWNADIHNKTAFTTNSIMNNPPIGLIYERHFDFILKQYREWQQTVRGKPVNASVELIKVKVEKPAASMTPAEALQYMLLRQRAMSGRDDEDE